MKIRNSLDKQITIYIGFKTAEEPDYWFDMKPYEIIDLKEKEINLDSYDLIEIQLKK